MEVSSSAGTRIPDPIRTGDAGPASPQGASRREFSGDAATQTPLRISGEVLADLAQRARSVLRPVNLDIEFSVDRDSGNTIIRIMDMETDTVIRQIPSEEMMALSKALDKMQGVLLQNKV